MLIFLHIEKAAGTSLRKMMYSGFGPLNVGWWGVDLEAGALATKSEIKQEKLVLGGHRGLLGYGDFFSETDIISSVVREPFDRICSLFEYDCKHHPETVGGLGASPSALISLLSENQAYRERLRNAQCYYLSGARDFKSVEERIASDNYLVGSVESVKAFVERISEGLCVHMGQLGYLNVNDSGQSYLSEYRSSEPLHSILDPLISEDNKLYSFVKNRADGVVDTVSAHAWDYNKNQCSNRNGFPSGSLKVLAVDVNYKTSSEVDLLVSLSNAHCSDVRFAPGVLDLFVSSVKRSGSTVSEKRFSFSYSPMRPFTLRSGRSKELTIKLSVENLVEPERMVIGFCGELGQSIDSQVVFNLESKR